MKKNLLQMAIFTIILIALDQFSKQLASSNLQESFILIENFFEFRYHENTGIAFSIPIPLRITQTLTAAFIFSGLYMAKKSLNLNKNLSKILVALVLGGAIGNLIDRSLYGYVIDFIAIWKWPVFNIADTAIVIGIFGLVLFYDRIRSKN